MSDILEGVEPKDLMVGDIILGCKGPSMANYTLWPEAKVLEVPIFAGGYYRWKVHINGIEGVETKRPGFIFRVRRSPSQALNSAKAHVHEKKHIDEFPGNCPLCGAKAYVSALAVAHKNEDAAKGCTARRV